MSRTIASFLLVAGWLVTSAIAIAAPRDKAAQKKIEEAIYTNFLNTDFDAAEGLLLGTIRACEDKCSPQLVAKAWMYVGVVRGSGRNDLAGATEAFKTALESDPNVALDGEIATEPVKGAFAKAKGSPAAATPTGGSGGGGKGTFTCTPSPTEIETRRPVPLQCETDTDLTSAKLRYKSFSGSWAMIKMEQHEGAWRATIPCNATQNTGKLRFYVEGFDGDTKAATLGDKEKPKSVDVVSESSAEPPAFPEEEAPKRCGIEDMPAGGAPPAEGGECVAWGAACSGDNCCEGNACISGTCGEAECKSDSDCKDGAECTAGKCAGGDEKGGGGPYPKNWIGLHFALDVASISTDKACAAASRDDHIACFYGNGATYEGTPVPAGAGKISGGFTPATMRVLATYERLFGPIGLEGRVGFAFNGGQTPKGGSAFLPVHVEVRGKYWILGEKAFSKPGFRPWVHLGGGLAQVDATVSVQIADCNDKTNTACTKATSLSSVPNTARQTRQLDATKQLGQSFITAGGGVMYAVAKNHGVVLNLNFMVPFPSSGFVIEPSLGYAVGF